MEQEHQQAGSAAVSSSLAFQRPGERETAAAAAELHASFDAIVAPLEAAAGKRLNGAGLPACRAAFNENPEGFERVAGRALERASSNPLGLLIRMVRDGDHLEERRPSTRRKPSRCSGCGSVPLMKEERLIIVGKRIGMALSERDGTCWICEEPAPPGRKGTIGELLGDRDGGFWIEWMHVECLKEDREADFEALAGKGSGPGSQNREAAA